MKFLRPALSFSALLFAVLSAIFWLDLPQTASDPVAAAFGYTITGALYSFALAMAGIMWGRFSKKQFWESAIFTGGQFVMSGLVAMATAGALTDFILKRTSDESFLTLSGAALWIFLLFVIETIAFAALQAARDWLKR
jgi:hypothetical protein